MSLHIGAEKDEIADVVLLPGDPLRAKFIAENFLTDVICYNKVRNMLGFTGTYKGKRISVQGAGMGMGSTAIYVNELLNEYNVKTLVRVGTCGGLIADLKIGEIILAMSASTNSGFNHRKFNGMDYAAVANFDLLFKAFNKAKELSIPVRVGGIFSTDTFYDDDSKRYEIWADHGVIGVEMESTVIYTLAAKAKARALSILTVCDNLVTEESSSSEFREQKVEEITRLTLETVC